MGFMDNIEKIAGEFAGGGSQQDAAGAAADHVQNMDAGELAGHLQQSVPNMDQSSLMALGQQLLVSFTSHPASPGDPETATQEAGTSTEAVAAGEPGAVGALVGYAKAHPEVLKSAASAFMQRNPGAIAQLAPGFLQGIMGRFGGSTS